MVMWRPPVVQVQRRNLVRNRVAGLVQRIAFEAGLVRVWVLDVHVVRGVPVQVLDSYRGRGARRRGRSRSVRTGGAAARNWPAVAGIEKPAVGIIPFTPVVPRVHGVVVVVPGWWGWGWRGHPEPGVYGQLADRWRGRGVWRAAAWSWANRDTSKRLLWFQDFIYYPFPYAFVWIKIRHTSSMQLLNSSTLWPF